jgi:tryptophanyl-tRNA synthetase
MVERYSQGGILDRIISAEEAASVIDQIAAIPDMEWEFVRHSQWTKEDANAINDVIRTRIASKCKPPAKVTVILQPEIKSDQKITYEFAYDTTSGARAVMQGFSKGHACIYKPENQIYTLAHLPAPQGVSAHILPALVDILNMSTLYDTGYRLCVNKVSFGDCDAAKAIQPVIDQKIEQIVAALK